MAKFRNGFVTNSSSSSFIICFARIEDEEKANEIIKKFDLEDCINTYDEVNEQSCFGCIGADWANATIWLGDKFNSHPDSKFIVITDSNGADYDENGEPEYDYDLTMDDAINAITEENGFVDIETAVGEGRDG